MKSVDLSGVISVAAVVAAVPAVADATAIVGLLSAVVSACLTGIALFFRILDIVRRVKNGKTAPDKAAEEVEKLKGALKK